MNTRLHEKMATRFSDKLRYTHIPRKHFLSVIQLQ